MPLDWCFQPGVKLDFRDKPDGHVITAKDVEDELKRIGHELKPLEIVVVNTAPARATATTTTSIPAAAWATTPPCSCSSSGVRLTGTDAWSWDAPFYFTAQKWAETTIPRSSGKATRPAATSATATSRSCTISRRCPADGFTISCFPHKIRGASAGWTRAVAIFEE